MEIVFENERLCRDCSQDRWMQRAWGPQRTKVLRRRLDQLRAAQNLEHFRLAFHRRCHELKANRRGAISIDLDGPNRLLIEPAADPKPTKPDGGLDWTRVTVIRVVAVENTHD